METDPNQSNSMLPPQLSARKHLHAGYKVGDQLFLLAQPSAVRLSASSALDCMLSSVISLRYGANYPGRRKDHSACLPRCESPVVFELKRIPPG